MDLKQEFLKVMEESVTMALATSVEDMPNVRVVTFAYTPEKKDRVFFTTFRGSQKIKEFLQNPQVACMPLPNSKEPAAQVRIFGKVQKSAITLEEVISVIGKKNADDADTLRNGAAMLDIYEVCIHKAYITVGMDAAQEVLL